MILIGLGANLPSRFGPPAATLRAALDALRQRGIDIASCSRFFASAPVPLIDTDPWYCNAVASINTVLSPDALLSVLNEVEEYFGRIRTIRNAPRIIDLDLLSYHDVICDKPRLALPHPRLHERSFVLKPLHDIAPHWRHPALGASVDEMLNSLARSTITFALHPGPAIMGIVNVTPDSFSDGGMCADSDRAIARAIALMEEGADIIDIGGASTRPGAPLISEEEEWRRVGPVLESLVPEINRRGIHLSVDTYNPGVMVRALQLGAHIINDVTGLRFAEPAIPVIAEARARVVLMHMQGTPETMQHNPVYTDVVRDVYDYLDQRIRDLGVMGISSDYVIADPGIGFGKTLMHNVALLQNMSHFHGLNVPLLIGASRKKFIAHLDRDDNPASERLGGSLAVALAAMRAGVQYVRVHDVAATRQAFAVAHTIENISRKPIAEEIQPHKNIAAALA